jgi:hypothetical protein
MDLVGALEPADAETLDEYIAKCLGTYLGSRKMFNAGESMLVRYWLRYEAIDGESGETFWQQATMPNQERSVSMGLVEASKVFLAYDEQRTLENNYYRFYEEDLEENQDPDDYGSLA